MANKALGTRQKLTFRGESAQKTLKPRIPLPVSTKQRAAAPQRNTASAAHYLQKHALKKAFDEPEKS